MAYPYRGEREWLRVQIPVELDEWLHYLARPRGAEMVCPAGETITDHVTTALLLYREMLTGIPSEASRRVLDRALADLSP